MAPLIKACIKSLNWVDAIFLYDDLSTDGTAEAAVKASTVPIHIERSTLNEVAFKTSELIARNYIIKKAFKVLDVDTMVLADADELFSASLKGKIENAFKLKGTDSMAFSIWHLYSESEYFHIWEDTINGIKMIDPHIRVIRKGKQFTPLFKDGGHPIIPATRNTACLHGPYHFHLKYFYKSTLPNYSLFFLPERFQRSDAKPYLRKLPFQLPRDISFALKEINWDKLPTYKATPNHGVKRVKFKKTSDALIHPKYYSSNDGLEYA